MLPNDLGEELLSPTSELVASRALERSATLFRQMDLDLLTLGFRCAERERAFAHFRAALLSRALRGALLWLACAYIPLEVSLEVWQYYMRRRIAHYAWAFVLVAASAFVSAFYLSQGRGRRGDLVGCALLVALSGAIVGRAAFARVDPLAPPVSLALLFFLGAGPPLLRLRFVAMVAAFLVIGGAHACALLAQPTRDKYVVWYEMGALLVGLVSALTCRALEHEQRAHFCSVLAPGAGLGVEGWEEGGVGRAREALDGVGLERAPRVEAGMSGGSGFGHGGPLDDALRELRELAHRMQAHLPSARVPTDVVERALGESGASSLAELLLRHGTRADGHPGGAASAGRQYIPPDLDGAAGAGAPVLLIRSSELPSYFTPYAHVRAGYRCELSARACAASLFELHNETLNVWTELLPAAAFSVAIARLLADDAVLHMPPFDRWLLTAGLVIALLVRPLCSAAAHLFYCVSDSRWYALWWSVDYISICAAILAASLVCARNAFYCEPELAHLFFVCSSGLLCTSMIAVLFSASSSVRAFSFLLFVLFCNVVPLCYQLLSKLDGWYHNDVPWTYIYHWVTSLGMFLLGLVIKSSALPEACAPGRFDLVGSSHQLWHVCINVAFVFGTLLPWRIYADWRMGVPCPAPREFAFAPPPSSPPSPLGLL